MRGWLIPATAGASLLAALVLSAAGQDGQAADEAAPPERPELLISETIAFHARRAPETDQQTNEDLEMAEDVEILGEVLRGALAQLYEQGGSPQWMSENLGVRPFAGWDVNTVGFPVRSPAGDQHLLWGIVDPSHDQGVNLNQLLVDPLQFEVPASDPKYMVLRPGGVAVERPEGIYLKDYGVVYHVQLDVTPPEEERPKETAANAWEDPPAGRSWENAGRSLRGEPPLEPRGAELPDPVMPTRADLVDTLLDVLAENARNLRHLKGEDRLTVAITFPREKSPATSAHDETTGVEIESPAARSDYASTADALMALGDEPVARALAFLARAQETRSSHEVSGDLHMRQQNYQKAIEAYEHALVLAATKATSVRTDADKAAASDLRRKLIQAYAAAGDLEKARTLIDAALASQPKSENDDAPSKPAQAIPLPARLVVTVSKSQLDDVAAGKMKREELNQHATIHYFKPPPETPGLGSRASRAAGGDGDVLLFTTRKPHGAAFVELDNPWLSPEAGNKTDVQSPLGRSPKDEKKGDKPRGSAY